VPATSAKAQWGFGGYPWGWGYGGFGMGVGGYGGLPTGYPMGMAYGYESSPGMFGPPHPGGYGLYGLPVAGLPIGFPAYGLVAPNPMFGLGLTPLGAQSGLAERYLFKRGTGTLPQDVIIQRKMTAPMGTTTAPAVPGNTLAPAGAVRPGP